LPKVVQKCVRLPIIAVCTFAKMLKLPVVFKFLKMVLNYALISRINQVPDWSIFHSSLRWIFLLFYSNFDKLSRFVHKSNVENYCNYKSKNRLQSATKIKGCIDRTRHRCMLFLAWVLDGSLKKQFKTE